MNFEAALEILRKSSYAVSDQHLADLTVTLVSLSRSMDTHREQQNYKRCQAKLKELQRQYPEVLGSPNYKQLFATVVREAIIFARLKYSKKSVTTHNTSLPINAEFLFYLFLDAKNCDAIVGDLEERYKVMHRKFGIRHANFWYWTQALSSVLPIVWAWAKKIVMKPIVAAITWAAAKHLLKDGSWLVMLAEVWKRIRL
jgi:hypothetical protein